MTTETNQATPEFFVRRFPKYVYRNGKGKENIQWRQAALDMYDDRTRLVSALREMVNGHSSDNSRALLRKLGEAE